MRYSYLAKDNVCQGGNKKIVLVSEQISFSVRNCSEVSKDDYSADHRAQDRED